MCNLKERLLAVKRYAFSALKGVVFLSGLYFLGLWAPSFFPSLANTIQTSPVLAVVLVIISVALTFFLFGSRFLTQARQWLKPVWYPTVLVWLIPFVGLMVPACIRGRNSIGFPLPGNRGGHDEPWDSIFEQVMPETTIVMFCVLTAAYFFVRTVKRAPSGIIRMAVLVVFVAGCLRSVHIGLFDYFGASTWGAGEMLEEMLFPDLPILLFWLGLALVPAWRITEDLIVQSPPASVEDWTLRGTLKKAFVLAGSGICGAFLLYLVTVWNLPSVDVLKTTEGLRTLLQRQGDSAVAVRLAPLRETPPHVANAFTAYYGERNSRITDLAHLISYRKGYSDLEEDILYLTIKILLSREEILNAWLATRSFGNGLLGPAVAAEKYCNKPFAELDLCEAAMLAPIPYAPHSNPIDDPADAKKRQQALLDEMVKRNLVSEGDRELCGVAP